MSAPRLTVRVLRGIGAALAEYEAGLVDGTREEERNLEAALRWYRAACERAGWARVYPKAPT